MRRSSFVTLCALFVFALTSYAQDSLNVRRLGQLYHYWDGAWAVAIAGNYAYVATSSTGLRIVNITNPVAPQEVGFYDTPDYAQGVAVSGNYCYVADGDSGLRIINVSNPSNPQEVGFYDTPGYAYGVAVAGNYCYVADQQSGLRIINVSNPASPQEVGFYDTPGTAYDVAVSGNYCYVADGSGLRVINITNPANPQEVGFYDTPGGEAYGVAVAGNYCYVADGNSGLRIVNISNPASPQQVGFYNTLGFAIGVAVADSIAYVADYYYFGIYDCSQALPVIEANAHRIPTSFSLSPVYPNPFNAIAKLTYTLPQRGGVRLELFDAAGRSVRTLLYWNQEAGTYTVTLNGESLPSGTYFARLTAGASYAIQPFTVLK